MESKTWGMKKPQSVENVTRTLKSVSCWSRMTRLKRFAASAAAEELLWWP